MLIFCTVCFSRPVVVELFKGHLDERLRASRRLPSSTDILAVIGGGIHGPRSLIIKDLDIASELLFINFIRRIPLAELSAGGNMTNCDFQIASAFFSATTALMSFR